ncbi:hypothetical protein OF83DRAFT_751031 [Amylostereum chailletii]|nr:hypothetical protein OF83DRAFT_751031 [Amylostereum chailletii]
MLATTHPLALALTVLNLCAPFARAQFSVYRPKDQVIFGGDDGSTSTTGTASAAAATYTGSAAYDPTVLEAPAPPSGLTTSFAVDLNTGITGLSIPQKGAFFGFSVEMSVANHVLGKNSTVLQVPFLNLLANIQRSWRRTSRRRRTPRPRRRWRSRPTCCT